MKIHLIGSRYELPENLDSLRKIVEVIHGEGHELVEDWVEPTYQLIKKGKTVPDLDWRSIYINSIDAVHKADVVIAESSVPSFSVGYQVATAMQIKKPILILNKQGMAAAPFPRGIEQGVAFQEYDDKGLKEIVTAFLKDNDIQLKDMRFNFFIDRPIYNYLRWAAHRTGKTKAEILRDLVAREIEKTSGKLGY